LHKRRAGTVIDPRRESIEDLTRLRQTMGELLFSGQYQQNPIPLEGNIIKAAYFKEYDVVPTPQPKDLFVISVDTAMKGDPHADYSVATAWMAPRSLTQTEISRLVVEDLAATAESA
jgi:hypothetical protein